MTVTISDDDPDHMGKLLAYKKHRKTLEVAPKVVKFVQDALLKEATTAPFAFIVDSSKTETNMFGEVVDLVRLINGLCSCDSHLNGRLAGH